MASDGIHGTELWKSDGTADGTTLVKDIESVTFWSGVSTLSTSAPSGSSWLTMESTVENCGGATVRAPALSWLGISGREAGGIHSLARVNGTVYFAG